MNVDHVEVTKRFEPDPELKLHVDDYYQLFKDKMIKTIGYNDVELETSFKKIRVSEQNLPNFVADLVRAASGTDMMMLNTGTIRSDCVIHKGVLKLKEINDMFPFQNLIIKLRLTGEQVHKALENAVSKYPAYEGRFPAISGVSFSFDPNKTPGQRVPLDSILVAGKGKLHYGEKYTIAVRDYLARGKDGFDSFKEGEMLNCETTAEELRFILIRFFELANDANIVEMVKDHQEGKISIEDCLKELQNVSSLSIPLRLLKSCYHLIAGVNFIEG